ncbi:MAG: hypothetical protein ACI9FD_002807 [Gammaproteobacteria bacterium]|jgi:hypothetical protein
MNTDNQVIEAANLQEYFKESLCEVLDQRKSKLTVEAEAYMVNLLVHYSRSDRFFELTDNSCTVKPLAMMYGEAVHAASKTERTISLRRLGDVALFIAGIFGPSLTNKAVGINYYISMGGCAYDWLSSDLECSSNHTMPSQTFRELADNFSELVDALDEFAGHSSLRGNRDLITQYEKWQRTRDPDIARKLVAQGLSLPSGPNASYH